MPLHEVVGVWASEEGNAPVTIYINPQFIKIIQPYGKEHHKLVIHGYESFIVTNDQVDMRSDEEIAKDLMDYVALHAMPDGDEN